MPNYNYNYTNQDYDLVASQSVVDWNSVSQNYIRIIIRNSDSGLIYKSVDIGSAIFYSSLSATSFDINISPFSQNLTEITTKTIGLTDVEDNDFQIYENSVGNVYLKPNEILNTYGLPQGNYQIQIDFLQQTKPEPPEFDTHYQFVIREISTSRREVRLKLLDKEITRDDLIIEKLTAKLNNNTSTYAFKHLLNTGAGNSESMILIDREIKNSQLVMPPDIIIQDSFRDKCIDKLEDLNLIFFL